MLKLKIHTNSFLNFIFFSSLSSLCLADNLNIQGHIGGKLVSGLAIQTINELDFGIIDISDKAGEIKLQSNGNTACPSDYDCSLIGNPGELQIIGDFNPDSLQIRSNQFNLLDTTGTNSIRFIPDEIILKESQQNNTGYSAKYSIGGILTIEENQAVGRYSGYAPIIINY